MPASLALIRLAYPDPRQRGRAVGIWAMGGAVASSAGPVLGGLVTLIDWRWIFLINVPAGVLALLMTARADRSPTRVVPFDIAVQITGAVAMGTLTFAVVDAGSRGFADPAVIIALILGGLTLAGFCCSQTLVRHPMIPPTLFESRRAVIIVVSGFAFPDTFIRGAHVSLLLASAVLASTTVLTLFLPNYKEIR